MAFALNTSAFGSTPNSQNNTNNASLFGAPKPSGSLFGAPQPAQQQSSSNIFGQSSQQQQQQPAGGLFGQPGQQQQPTGGLFGQSTQQQSVGGLFGQPTGQQQPAGGLFGQSTGQQQQQPTGGLFGQPAGQQQQQPSGGLFGQTAGQQQQQSTGGLFGQSSQQQPQQQQNAFGGGSLFGNNSTTNNSTTNQPQQGGNIFGGFGSNTQQQPQQQSTGLFGTTLQAQPTVPAGGFGGGSIFGNNQQNQQQQQQGLGFSNSNQVSNIPAISKSTKFNDIPDELKRMLENIDSHIQGRVQISKDLHQRKLGDEPTKGQELIRGIHKDLVNTSTLTRNDLHFTKDMKSRVDQAVQDTIVATRIVDGFKNAQGGGGSGYLKDHANFPLDYFTRMTESMKQRLVWYNSAIEQIERKLSSSAGQTQTPQGISATLQAQHTTFLALASKTAALDTELQKIKVLYTQLWRAKTGSVRDPFNQLDRNSDGSDFGMNSLNVK